MYNRQMIALETKNLEKNFDGVKAINNLSISIKKGLVTSIVGPNGSGKTTLVNILTGIYGISGGIVTISDHNLEKIKSNEVKSYGITRTFQNIRLFEQMTVLDNILVVLTERQLLKSLFEKHKEHHLNQAEEVLRKVGLWEKKNDLALNLSYGQRKLLEIARALSMKTEIYLLDEPFAGLFPEMRKIVSSVIKELKENGKTVVLIEHNMDVIRELSDHIIVLDAGKLLAEGDVSILENKDVIEAYLGE